MDYPLDENQNQNNDDLLCTTQVPISQILANPKKISAIDRLPVIG